MKTKRNLLIGILLGAIIGWALGFLRLPFIEKNASFFLGFITSSAIVLLAFILLFVWNKHAALLRLIGKNPNKKNNYAVIWIWVTAFVVSGGLVSSFLVFNQNTSLTTKIQNQQQKIEQQAEIIASNRASNGLFLMANVLDKVDDELKNNPNRILSDGIIGRIVALSHVFQPHKHFEGDSLSDREYSLERGQLLVALANMNMDSSSLHTIMHKAVFKGADLRNADLRGIDLWRVDLQGAEMQDADLSGANLSNVDLRTANLWGANLTDAKLIGSDLRRAKLNWATLNGADLSGSNLCGVDFTDSQMKKANLSATDLRWAILSGVFLNGANLNGAYLLSAKFEKANMSGVELNKTGIPAKGWFEQLNEWQVTGAKEIQEGYEVVDDLDFQTKHSLKKTAAE